MRLSAQVIKNFQNINSFDKGTEWNIRYDEPSSLYLQLVDADQENLRYIPTGTVVSVVVKFPMLSPTSPLTKTATLVNASDKSLWVVNITNTERPMSGNVQIEITEDGVTRRFVMQQALAVELYNQGGC